MTSFLVNWDRFLPTVHHLKGYFRNNKYSQFDKNSNIEKRVISEIKYLIGYKVIGNIRCQRISNTPVYVFRFNQDHKQPFVKSNRIAK